MASNRKAALGFIFLTLLIDVTGLGIIIPVLPKLIEELIHGNISIGIKVWWMAHICLCNNAVFIFTIPG